MCAAQLESSSAVSGFADTQLPTCRPVRVCSHHRFVDSGKRCLSSRMGAAQYQR